MLIKSQLCETFGKRRVLVSMKSSQVKYQVVDY